jgi:O-methyltransferase involved in polyketide biosynthesis
MVARSRYAEDQLAKAVEQGVAQYVVLGAGLDTLAYRNPHSIILRVFEVDHPATQAWKLERLQAAGIAIPQSLKFVPVDFERRLRLRLARVLLLAGSDALPHPGILHSAFHRATASGQRRGLRLRCGPKLLNLRQRLALHLISGRVAAAGEPFPLFFRPTELAGELRNVGFQRTEILRAEEINARYFTDRADGLRVRGGLGQLMGAWI